MNFTNCNHNHDNWCKSHNNVLVIKLNSKQLQGTAKYEQQKRGEKGKLIQYFIQENYQ